MKRSEVAKLVTIIWATENTGRQPTNEDVELWWMFATEGAWESYDAALRAYVVHRSEHPDFPLRPGHITQVLERVRASGGASHQIAAERPPAAVMEAENFDAAYLVWQKREAARRRGEHVAAFARGETASPRRAIEAGS